MRIQDPDRLQRVVELMEKELAPWVPYGKVYLDVVREKVTRNAEMIRVDCRVNNLGEFTAENIQMAVRPSMDGELVLIPKAGWTGIPGSGEAGVRTFQAEHALHPKQSIQAIIQFTPTFQLRLSANNTRSHYVEVVAS